MTEKTNDQPHLLELKINSTNPQSWLTAIGLQPNDWESDSLNPDQGHLFWRNQKNGSLTVDSGQDLTTITCSNPRHPTMHEVNLTLRPTPDEKLILAGANMCTQLPSDGCFRTYSFIGDALTQIDPPLDAPTNITAPDWLQVIKEMYSL